MKGWSSVAPLIASCCLLGCADPDAGTTSVTPGVPESSPVASSAGDGHSHDHAGGHGHDHDHATLPSLLAEIREADETIRTAFESGKPGDAHGTLHDVFHLAEDLKVSGDREDMTEEQRTAIDAAAETLLDAYGELDSANHGGDAVEYSSVEADISGAMDTLAEIAG